jgi:hypothetical protein
LGIQAANETDVVVTDVDVHKTAQCAGVIQDPDP